jgi:hypothetical protein
MHGLPRDREQAWVGKTATGFPSKKSISAVSKGLRGQMVQGPTSQVLEVDF